MLQYFVLFLVLRLLSAFIVNTFFVPDEFWQSLEVAHYFTFGYGYLTWEWKKKIRSASFPMIFHLLFKIFPDSLQTCVLMPKIFQALLSSVGDIYTYKLSCKLFGKNCGQWTVFNLSLSWFLFYCSSRTLTNVIETSLTACGLYFYPWFEGKGKRLSCGYLWFAGLSVMMRPTAIVTWFPLYVYHCLREQDFTYLIKHSLVAVSSMFFLLLLCDRWFYGEWVVTPYNFYVFNWSYDIGAFYGRHNFFWYFYSGMPTVLGLQTAPFLLGLRIQKLTRFYLLVFFVLLVFSFPSHKEIRFLLPMLPLCLVLCSETMNKISRGQFWRWLRPWMAFFFIGLVAVTHVCVAMYTSVVHQRGTISIIETLSAILDNDSNVLFLMPCHSTPYYSHIHRNISMRFLTCDPEFSNNENYQDEAETFYENPERWLLLEKPSPTHLVLFDSLADKIPKWIRSYELCFEAFHTHFPDERIGRHVQLYCKVKLLR